jgi:hypothetical protein
MLKTDSIQLFRDTVNLYLPEYFNVSIEDVKKDLLDLLEIDVIVGLIATPDTSQQSLNFLLTTNKILREEIIDSYFSALALLYIENPQTKDELVVRLIDANQKNFKSYIEEALLMKEAFQRLERKEKKEYLKNLEVQLEAEELQVAFTPMAREQKKVAFFQVEEINNQVAASHERPAQKFTLRSIIRIAASVIILSIPAGLLYLFLTGNPTHNSAKKTVKNKRQTQEYFASNSLKMNLPGVTSTQGTKQAIPTSKSLGFGNSEDEIIIKIQNYEAQLTYLETKKKKLQAEISNLESLSFKHKKSTLDSLRTGVFNIDALKKEIQLKEGIYTFKDKKVTLQIVKKKDLQKMKVFNFNDVGTDQFYLKMESNYYLLTEPKGKLKRLADQNIIDSLNLKDLE